MSTFNPNLCEVIYNPQFQACSIIYKAYVKSEEFRRVNKYSLEVIGDQPFKRMLRDMRLLSNLPSADREWFKAEVAPTLVAKGLKFLAIVVPTATTAHNFFEKFFDYAIPKTVTVRYFHNEKEAQQWLFEARN